ncbi:MAG: hypothetical protein R3Y09_07505 [Clostridia bacterium]
MKNAEVIFKSFNEFSRHTLSFEKNKSTYERLCSDLLFTDTKFPLESFMEFLIPNKKLRQTLFSSTAETIGDYMYLTALFYRLHESVVENYPFFSAQKTKSFVLIEIFDKIDFQVNNIEAKRKKDNLYSLNINNGDYIGDFTRNEAKFAIYFFTNSHILVENLLKLQKSCKKNIKEKGFLFNEQDFSNFVINAISKKVPFVFTNSFEDFLCQTSNELYNEFLCSQNKELQELKMIAKLNKFFGKKHKAAIIEFSYEEIHKKNIKITVDKTVFEQKEITDFIGKFDKMKNTGETIKIEDGEKTFNITIMPELNTFAILTYNFFRVYGNYSEKMGDKINKFYDDTVKSDLDIDDFSHFEILSYMPVNYLQTFCKKFDKERKNIFDDSNNSYKRASRDLSRISKKLNLYYNFQGNKITKGMVKLYIYLLREFKDYNLEKFENVSYVKLNNVENLYESALQSISTLSEKEILQEIKKYRDAHFPTVKELEEQEKYSVVQIEDIITDFYSKIFAENHKLDETQEENFKNKMRDYYRIYLHRSMVEQGYKIIDIIKK